MLTVSIVIPTKNEEANIAPLLSQVLPYGYEVTIVDNSEDNTPAIARNIGARVVQGTGGLGQAIITGINASHNDVVLVMDADLSHNPQDIPRLLKPILEQGADLVIASRYIKGGDVSEWDFKRRMQSLIGVKLMQLVTRVSDSNSGFFAFRKSILKGVELKPHSWKIMLEVLFKGHWVFKTEVPIKFGDRRGGVSKNNKKERFRHAIHIIKLLVYKFPKRYISFTLVGGVGAIAYFVIFWAITEHLHIWYGFSYFLATMYAIVQNYVMNHFITFRKEKRHNHNHLLGLSKYIGGSWVGELVEYVIMLFLTEVFGVWYILSDFIGSGFSSIIKYVFFKEKVWGNKKAKRTAQSADYEWMAYFKGLPWQKRWKRIIAKITKEFAEYPGGSAGKLIDIGCGSSPQGVLINHEDYVGFDPNEGKIEYMKSKNLANCRFTSAGLETLHHLNGYFDTAIFIEVIEHLRDRREAERILSQIRSLLKPQGKLVVATPNFGGFMGKWMDRLYGVFQKNAYQKEHQLKCDFYTLRDFLEVCGFRYVKSEIPSGADMVCLFQKR